MANIKPFKAIRPANDKAADIAALPYDVYNRKEAKKAAEDRPLSFLHIDRPEMNFPEDFDMYDDAVYQKAHDILWEMLSDGHFIQDIKPCYYIYELTMDGRIQTGIVAASSIDDYDTGIIKKHENTRREKEEDRVRHVDICDAQTGPIFLAYRENKDISEVVDRIKNSEAIYDFTSDDGIRHRCFIIDNDSDIQIIKSSFNSIESIYIADGHHRCASAVRVGKMRREANPGYSREEEFNFFLSVLFPDNELKIMDYNRVIKDMNSHSAEEVISLIEKCADVTRENEAVSPRKKGEFGFYIDNTWYRCNFNKDLINDDPVEGLDVSILQKNILEPVFGITDPKTDDRIDFVGGIRGLLELEKRCHEDCFCAFSMYPTSIEELFNVSDAGRLMPPKSTWFEPKLRSGLFIHALSDN